MFVLAVRPTGFSRFHEEFDLKMLESLHSMERKYFYVVGLHNGKRQIASLLSPAFRELPFSISLLTDSLVYIIHSGGGRRLAK